MFADGLAMGEYFRCIDVFLRWHITQFFHQGQVDIGFDIALGSGISVPIPGATEVTTLFNDTDVFDAGLP